MAPSRSDQVDLKTATDRATRFLARLDEHLPTLADDGARRAFLDRQLAGWECRYARFIATEGGSEPVANSADPPQAADFLLTIAGIAQRQGAYARDAARSAASPITQIRQRGITMISNRSTLASGQAADEPLGSAILSLLVAADQRCPAIIGQAHLLYHARFSAQPDHAGRTFAQLKRDAADLLQAIADVEAAMQDTK
jgi:hypothetical protein